MPSDFRSFLQLEIVQRCKTNPQYSVRAFAKLLKIDSSTLSQILRGRRAITERLVMRLGDRLSLSPTEIKRFLNNNRPHRDPSDKKAKRAARRDPGYNLSVETYHLIADWYHFAVFELVTVIGFESEPKWIARKLGITVMEAQVAIERLKRLGLIIVAPNGDYKQGSSFITTTGNPFTDLALRRVQAQILSKSMTALEEIPFEQRDHTGTMMAIHSKRLPKAKEMIREFRRSLCEYLQQDTKRDCVYQLGVSLFPLTISNKGAIK